MIRKLFSFDFSLASLIFSKKEKAERRYERHSQSGLVISKSLLLFNPCSFALFRKSYQQSENLDKMILKLSPNILYHDRSEDIFNLGFSNTLIVSHTCTRRVMVCGSMVNGLRRMFSRDIATKAFSASRTFSREERTKVAKLQKATRNGEMNQLNAEMAFSLAAFWSCLNCNFIGRIFRNTLQTGSVQ
jgi:hypothetical protein